MLTNRYSFTRDLPTVNVFPVPGPPYRRTLMPFPFPLIKSTLLRLLIPPRYPCTMESRYTFFVDFICSFSNESLSLWTSLSSSGKTNSQEPCQTEKAHTLGEQYINNASSSKPFPFTYVVLAEPFVHRSGSCRPFVGKGVSWMDLPRQT